MQRKISLFLVGLFLVLSFSIKVQAQDLNLPNYVGHVNDFAGILSAETKSLLERQISDFNKATSHEIVVVTVEDLRRTYLEDFAVKLFEKWKIGEKELDNGILLLVAPNDREVKIEVGYGLEGILPDATANKIIKEIIIPEFKNNDYNKGVVNGVDAIIKVTEGEKLDFKGSSTGGSKSSSKIPAIIIWFLFFIGYSFFSVMGKSKRWWPGGLILGGGGLIGALIAGIALFGAIAIVIGFAILGFILDYVFSKYKIGQGKGGKGGGMWFFGGGGGSSGGGGFGGFGGGSSGGGGASGSW